MATRARAIEWLNKMNSVAKRVGLGTVVAEIITKANAMLADLTAIRRRVNVSVICPATLAIKAGGSAVVKSTTAIVVSIAGAIVYKAASTDMSAIAGTLATAKSAGWAFYIGADGTITTSAKTADQDTVAAAIAALPATPNDKVLLGFLVVSNATGSDFVGGNTALDAASVTSAYFSAVGAHPGLSALTATAITDISA